MDKTSKIRGGIGRFFGLGKHTPEPAQHQQTAAIEPADYTIQQDVPMPVTSLNMTLEQLKARRLARPEKATNVVEGFHIRVMLRILDGIALLGPFYITLMTTSELGELFTNGKALDWKDQTSINMYGAALFGEVILLGLTFISQYMRSYLYSLESDLPEYESTKRIADGAMLMWYLFAAIGALGQGVYLYNYWHPAANLFNWLLIIGRVCIYTGGDYVAARYLCWRIPSLTKLIREDRERDKLYEEMERADAERLKRTKEADAHIRKVEIEMENAERRNEVMGNVERKYGEVVTQAFGKVSSMMDKVFDKTIAEVDAKMQQLPAPKDKDEY
jgi:hypothetical protein